MLFILPFTFPVRPKGKQVHRKYRRNAKERRTMLVKGDTFGVQARNLAGRLGEQKFSTRSFGRVTLCDRLGYSGETVTLAKIRCSC